MGNLFLDITVIICLAAGLSLIFRLLKQPEILAYILTGIIVGPLIVFRSANQDILQTMSQLGITLLLFMVGLEIRVSDLFALGKSLLAVALGQIFITFSLGFVLASLLNFAILPSFYIAVALTFSTTVIVVKILSDKRDLHSLYAKISLVILLAQDLLAILLLMFLSGFSQQTGGALPLVQFFLIAIKGVVLFTGVWYLSINIFPKLFELIARSSETLFLVSMAWVFGLTALVSSPYVGFSTEIGGFLAGLALANSIVNYQIIAKAKILRDFFIVIFFVLLGAQMNFVNFSQVLIPAIIISIFVLVAKPLIIMIILGLTGYRKRTSFLTGITHSQISEFSLIIIFLGNKLGHVSDSVVSLITLVAIITFAFSSYLILQGNKLYLSFGKKINFLERKHNKKDEMIAADGFENLKDHVVVVGGDQMGQSILDALSDSGDEVVVIDFDPTVVQKLVTQKVHRLFGDISDLDIQERAQIDNAKLVISTIPDVEDNLLLLKELRHENRKAKVVVMALDVHDAKLLYKAKADYVILPHLAGGMHIAKMLVQEDWEKIEKLKQEDLGYLK
ncbi:MAG: cation:proton antiporter [Patescibacteria group bacterium]|nr:cation:proton antiporter [Patescibacteria group bacterium]